MKSFDQLRIGLTGLVTLTIWSLLIWQHFHNGVPAHHLLANPEMPRISNGYRGLLLPVLTWGLLSLSKRHMIATDSSLQPVIVGLLAGLAYGIALSVAYFSGYQSIASTLFFSLLPLALLLPVYRPECLLGFILGMSAGFGAVLPTIFGTIMALITFPIHRFVGLPQAKAADSRASSCARARRLLSGRSRCPSMRMYRPAGSISHSITSY